MRLSDCLPRQASKRSNLSRSVIQDILIECGRLADRVPENTEIFQQFENMNEAMFHLISTNLH